MPFPFLVKWNPSLPSRPLSWNSIPWLRNPLNLGKGFYASSLVFLRILSERLKLTDCQEENSDIDHKQSATKCTKLTNWKLFIFANFLQRYHLEEEMQLNILRTNFSESKVISNITESSTVISILSQKESRFVHTSEPKSLNLMSIKWQQKGGAWGFQLAKAFSADMLHKCCRSRVALGSSTSPLCLVVACVLVLGWDSAGEMTCVCVCVGGAFWII